MRIATLADVDLIRNILLVSFRNDPHVTWLLEESKNEFKLEVLIDYVVHQTLRRGEIYLTDDNNAVALWDFERSERMSFHYLWRSLTFLIQIGIKSVVRIMKSEALVHNTFSKYPRYCHLCMIGVLPEEQGKGLASALMNSMIQRMKGKSIPVFLETANLRNVDIYKKKGFKIFKTLTIGDQNLFLMSTESRNADQLFRVVANHSSNPLGFETTTDNSNFTKSFEMTGTKQSIDRRVRHLDPWTH